MALASVEEADAPERARRILSNAFALLRSPPDIHWIPAVLWKQASKVLGDQSTLKAKYFLRAFVDEIPSPVARRAVRRMAYGIGNRPDESVLKRRESFAAGCVALHSVLSKNASSLNAWTDGSVSAKTVHHTMSDPVPYMEHLLLPSAVDLTTKRNSHEHF